ncbi:DUF397 domain-containing protein [Actinomadura sp. K4S16]|uniref:DUF397 domain-containing protein n=1 Tax=Actinomadura sp. K4S16 TaxID=1316147 RepID=UPI0011ED3D83|nr:DUF397 domain-containing protein [Actinomadura sp. K4S16]
MHSEQAGVLWRKSSHSDGTGGECVEVAATPGRLLIRDSKDPNGPHLDLSRAAACALMGRLRGEKL